MVWWGAVRSARRIALRRGNEGPGTGGLSRHRSSAEPARGAGLPRRTLGGGHGGAAAHRAIRHDAGAPRLRARAGHGHRNGLAARASPNRSASVARSSRCRSSACWSRPPTGLAAVGGSAVVVARLSERPRLATVPGHRPLRRETRAAVVAERSASSRTGSGLVISTSGAIGPSIWATRPRSHMATTSPNPSSPRRRSPRLPLPDVAHSGGDGGGRLDPCGPADPELHLLGRARGRALCVRAAPDRRSRDGDARTRALHARRQPWMGASVRPGQRWAAARAGDEPLGRRWPSRKRTSGGSTRTSR